jgi:alkylhydroperoxidase/carboxymuconolactone decarboxylase family protein YurZ
MSDEDFVEDQAGFRLDPAGSSALDPRTAALLRVGACAAIWSPGVRLEWSTRWALAAGAAEDEIANALAIASVAGLGPVVAEAPDVATALGYDITAALEEPDGHCCSAAGHVDVPADRRMSNPTRWG